MTPRTLLPILAIPKNTSNKSLDSKTKNLTKDTVFNFGGGSLSRHTTYVWTESYTTASHISNIVIGTSKLAVEGNIRTREVRVDQDTWPDYVFNKDYNLPSLQEIQKHIKEKGHLPNMPSAKEVEENGIQLGEMNKLLLEKIEELTLYILRQEDKIKKQDVFLNNIKN